MMQYKGYLAEVEFDDDAIVFHGEAINTRDVITFQGNTVDEVIRVEPRADNTSSLVFENNEKRVFAMKPFLDKRPFAKLKGSPLFMKTRVSLGTVVWPRNIDIAPETLWDFSKPFEQI